MEDPTRRPRLSKSVRSGLDTLAGLVSASSAEEMLGINPEQPLSKEERQTVKDVERAVTWISYIVSKSKKEKRE